MKDSFAGKDTDIRENASRRISTGEKGVSASTSEFVISVSPAASRAGIRMLTESCQHQD
jgi:hypothetical protein